MFWVRTKTVHNMRFKKLALLAVFAVSFTGQAAVVELAIAQDRGAARAVESSRAVNERGVDPSSRTPSTDTPAARTTSEPADTRFGSPDRDGDAAESRRAKSSGDTSKGLPKASVHRPDSDCRRPIKADDRFKPNRPGSETRCDSRPTN